MRKSPPTPPAQPANDLDASTAEQVLKADLSNLLRKVKSGKPLSRWERNLVESKGQTNGTKSAPTFAANQSELAEILNTSRQRVSYYARQSDAPAPREDGRLDVGAWRRYLTARGRLPDSTTAPGSPLTFEDGLLAAHERITDWLPRTFAAALIAANVSTTPEQFENTIQVLQMLIAANVSEVQESWGFEPILPTENIAPWN